MLKRRKEFKTNYKKRLRLLLSRKPRLVIRKTNKYIIAHIVNYDYENHKDYTVAYVTSKKLREFGLDYKSFSLKNIPISYLTGYLIGKIALSKNIKEAILDSGLNRLTKGCRIYAVLKGAIDAGLKIPFNERIFPDENRLNGSHIKNFNKDIIKKVKENINLKYG
ncbi:MAG: 50S ribosomal protein L18 [Candidatus Aenigmarchaeota archaeon]|nr:50S ribosomal protein L18 [Candidatus Aenigmarchaeota archaeon]MDW8149775.1 50S ribosomal protein L18 [Candidatus Aenigmarchaeota archaeon]